MNVKHASTCPTALLVSLVLGASLLASVAVSAQSPDPSIAVCLKAWGKHPFGGNPPYKTLAASV